jgi:hypothetical protein
MAVLTAAGRSRKSNGKTREFRLAPRLGVAQRNSTRRVAALRAAARRYATQRSQCFSCYGCPMTSSRLDTSLLGAASLCIATRRCAPHPPAAQRNATPHSPSHRDTLRHAAPRSAPQRCASQRFAARRRVSLRNAASTIFLPSPLRYEFITLRYFASRHSATLRCASLHLAPLRFASQRPTHRSSTRHCAASHYAPPRRTAYRRTSLRYAPRRNAT